MLGDKLPYLPVATLLDLVKEICFFKIKEGLELVAPWILASIGAPPEANIIHNAAGREFCKKLTHLYIGASDFATLASIFVKRGDEYINRFLFFFL
jgi:hypothetical protein